MLKIDIPERGTIELQHAVFDVNGTLAVDGIAIAGIAEKLDELSDQLTIHLVTSGTHERLQELERDLGFRLQIAHRSEEKLRYVRDLGPSKVIAIGNGANDTTMLRLAALGIAVMTKEGVSIRALQAADVLVANPHDAIDLLLKPKRLVATLRG